MPPTTPATDREIPAMHPFDPQGSPRTWVAEKTPTLVAALTDASSIPN